MLKIKITKYIHSQKKKKIHWFCFIKLETIKIVGSCQVKDHKSSLTPIKEINKSDVTPIK